MQVNCAPFLRAFWKPSTTFKFTDEPTELIAAFTHFSKACAKLGIKIIKAYSPQAKGRVERKHAVFQDRFVKELQLKNIKTISGANTFLENHFLNQINEKFAKPPADPTNAHRDALPFGDLKQIFCWEYTRQVQNDWTISFESKCYQIQKTPSFKVKAKQKIIVRQHLEGNISLWQSDVPLSFKETDYRPKSIGYVKKGYDSAQLGKIARENKHKSPWNRFNPGWLKPKKKMETQQLTAL